MRRIAYLPAVLILLASTARAQGNSATPLLADSITPTESILAPVAAIPAAALPSSSAAQNPPLRGVLPEAVVPWQIGANFTYVRFYEAPGVVQSQTGFNVSGIYYIRDWLGADMELFSVYGSESGKTTQLLFFGVGPRIRHSLSDNLDVWAHAQIGGARLTPLTQYSNNDSALGYAFGAGVDINARHRIGYRLEADMLGTRFFGTTQTSPKISAGVFFNF